MSRPRVLLLHPILEPALSLLQDGLDLVHCTSDQAQDPAQVADLAEGCQGIVSLITDRVDAALLATPGLRVVANVGVGFDNIDLVAATHFGVLITNTPGVLDETTADFAFALMLSAARRLVAADRMLREGDFMGWQLDLMLGVDVHGSTLGVVGLGRIGRALARRARGFGMRILYNSRTPAPDAVESELGARAVGLDELLGESDFVSLHVPLTTQTRHLIGERELGLMRPTSVLINTSRGPVVDERALARALSRGTIFAAGLDVYEHEPEVDLELRRMPNAVLAPHIASASIATRSAMSELAARNLLQALAGERPAHLVNAQVWR
ncbi:MAG TPA: D-glycerate dehydrogenase [Candidatus Nitrosotalea sp.]|nr:D-glycerate dehydrogenase [Candidatus Nitrosotalea sp.]